MEPPANDAIAGVDRYDPGMFPRLYTYQREHAAHLANVLSRGRRALDASDTGAGKTDIACAIAAVMNLRLIVISTLAVIGQWFATAHRYGCVCDGVGNYESIRVGRHFATAADARNGVRSDCPYLNVRKVRSEVTFEWTLMDANKYLIVVDEAHRGNNASALTGAFVMTLSELDSRVLLLSATIADTVGCFRTSAAVLGLAQPEPRAYARWVKSLPGDPSNDMQRIGNALFPTYGGRISVTAVEKHARGCLREAARTIDVLADATDALDAARAAESAGEITYDDVLMVAGLADVALKDAERADEVAGEYGKIARATTRKNKHIRELVELDDDLQPIRGQIVCGKPRSGVVFGVPDIRAEVYVVSDEVERAIELAYDEIRAASVALKQKHLDASNALAAMTYARMRTELAKVPLVAGIALKYLNRGYAVDVFVNFDDTADQLVATLGAEIVRMFGPGDTCACDAYRYVTVRGGQTLADRDASVAAFQSNAARLLIANTRAGGTGLSLHDLHGRARATLIMPPQGATTLKQCIGRTHRVGTMTDPLIRIIYTKGKLGRAGGESGPDAGGVEERVAANLNADLRNMAWLTDRTDRNLFLLDV